MKTISPLTNRTIQGPHLKFLGLICALVLSGGALMAAPLPLVSVTVSPSTVNRENLQPAQFTISLSAPASHDIGVVFFMTGTARLGFDYTLIGNFNRTGQTIIIPAGQTFVTVTLQPRTLDARFVRENAMMNLVHDLQVPHTYSLGSLTRANVIIQVE